MHETDSRPDRRGIQDPIRPEEVEPVGRLLAEHYEEARRTYGESSKPEDLADFLGFAFALEDHIKEHGEPVETATRTYRIGAEGELYSQANNPEEWTAFHRDHYQEHYQSQPGREA